MPSQLLLITLIILSAVACDDASDADEPCAQEPICVHVRDGQVPLAECSIGRTPGENQATDPRSVDGMAQYFDTQADYQSDVGCALPEDAPPDCDEVEACLHVRDGEVPVAECRIGRTPGENQATDPRSVDGMTQYFDTQADYTLQTRCAPE